MKVTSSTEQASEYFMPIANAAPRTLDRAQIEQYNRLGYISPLSLFDTAESSEIREYINSLLSQVGDNNRYAINCYQARLGGLWDICTDNRILDAVEDIIGPHVICWASHLFCKMPFDKKRVPWHQDADYWHLSPKRTVTVWLAIDDTDEDNSAMEFLPATHTLGPLPVKPASDETVLSREADGIPTDRPPFINMLRA